MNECELDFDLCDENASCANTDGSYKCTCGNGNFSDGRSCSDINDVQLKIIIVTSTRLDATIVLVPSVVNVNQDMLVAVKTAVMSMNARKPLVMSTKIVFITLDPINVCASQVIIYVAIISSALTPMAALNALASMVTLMQIQDA